MEITFLGTGAGVPSKNRNVTAIMLKLLDERNEMWLFDCGEGTQHQILQTTLKPRKVTKIFITHLHGDHIYGLPGFLSSRAHQGGDDKLTLYGPKGLRQFVTTSLKVSQSKLGYPLEIIELTEDQGVAFADQQFKVTYQVLKHGIRSYGYRIEEADQAGQLMVDKAMAAGVPNGPLLGQLKAGKTITLADGQVLHGADFVGPDKAGRKVTILGDTRYCQGAIDLAQGVDMLVHEATFAAADSKQAHDYFHSSADQAGRVAKQAGAKQLILTHISARYVGKLSQQLIRDARQEFSNTYLANDFDSFTIGQVD
ncbi:ribonuclease Z [Aerococcus urinaehominis]|uniref:Ribonuclease Z n=1 Tax=Aerococcus urinaehominis TaxID=128944 RepID=A0A120IAM4_9LACT|nr:ribonuclease Z [Aerococcus urinaehominis]AMB98528.1 ribonuclease Z [Aerococcus urinaehominis]SDL79333.1 ribonuclease Z [Aerococcus urinaehominis]